MNSSLKHIKLRYRVEKNRDKPYVAYAENIDAKHCFYIGSYSSIEKRKQLAIKLLEMKIKTPSSEFRNFMKNQK